MSAKRKSPPSKLPEGSEILTSDRMTDTVATALRSSHPDNSTKRDNDSSLEEHSPKRAEESAFPYIKMSPTSETSSAIASGSEYDDFFSNDEDGGHSPPQKRQRTHVPATDMRNFENGFPYPPYDPTSPLFLGAPPPLSSLLALQQHSNYERLHLNNNNTLYNNNNNNEQNSICGSNNNSRKADTTASNTNSNKKSMDDVLKRLTSKMNDNTIKEDRSSHSPSSKR
ncbi:hypothetical protein U1Q18_047435, partial [Sarracenia purpurea var. burkii]